MTDYVKSTDFATKDGLTTGDPNKVVKGTEIDDEFNTLATSSATKLDVIASPTTDNLISMDASGKSKDSGVLSTEVVIRDGDAVEGNIGIFDVDGNIVDSGAASAAVVGGRQGDKMHWPTVSNAADTDHDITLSTGKILDTVGTTLLVVATALTKRIDASWAAGDTNGGMASAITLTASATYHFFIIYDVTNDLIDAGWDQSTTATNLLADATDYTLYRRIFSHVVDGSANIYEFIQYGDWFEYNAPITNANGQLGEVDGLRTTSAPSNVGKAEAVIHVGRVGTGVNGIRPAGSNDTGKDVGSEMFASARTDPTFHDESVPIIIRVDDRPNRDIRINNTDSTDEIRIDTIAYIDPRLS